MKANCQPVDGLCSQCGEQVGAIRTCPKGNYGHLVCRDPCPHLLEPTGAFALVKCQGCCGNVQKKIPVHACALHGDCVPKIRGGITGWRGEPVSGRLCAGCGDNPSRATIQQAKPQSETPPPAPR